MKCRICDNISQPFGSIVTLRKYEVQYYQCPHCGFVQTEQPYWLEESYSNAITDADIGPVNRAVVCSTLTKAVLLAFFDPNARFVDYGAGYGIFVRRMRDLGFDFYFYDKFCENLLAKQYEAGGHTDFEALTAFEVFEHLVEPRLELTHMLHYSDSIFFSTELLPENNPMPGKWWYYVPDFGQHVSIYTFKSLQFLAQQFGLNIYTSQNQYHLLTRKVIPQRWFNLICHRKTAWAVGTLLSLKQRQRSLLQSDFAQALEKGH